MSSTEPSVPAVAVLPYGTRQGSGLYKTPLNQLLWPLGRPARLMGSLTLAELEASAHLIVFPRTETHIALRRHVRAHVSLIMAEPSVIHAKHLRLLRLSHRRFFRILTFNADLLDQLPNAVLFPLGTTWVEKWETIAPVKSDMCSLIASAKRDSEGHKLRHSIAEAVSDQGRDVALLGSGYKRFDAKAEGLAPYRYSVVIENVREQNYFSEKLLDCVFCETIPIYWGCPNLSDFMDTDSMILCESGADIMDALGRMSESDYRARQGAIAALKPTLAQFVDLEKRAAQAVRDAAMH